MKILLVCLIATAVLALNVDISMYRNHIHNYSSTELRLTEIKNYERTPTIKLSLGPALELLLGER